ncbi:hypothetical protein [Acidovorax sp.]|uniref:hypothetical protein n=1 Tax=Acidovorax sp. TaxID=1872122 RepID=UPI00391FB969
MNFARLLPLLLLSIHQASFGSDPLAEFKAIVDTCKVAFQAKPATKVAFNSMTQAWTKYAFTPAEISYDVRRSESLVRPFTAFVEILESRTAEKAADEAAAAQLEVSVETAPTAQKTVVRNNFAYENGRWVLIGGTYTSSMRMRGEKRFDAPTSLKNTPEEIGKHTGELAECRGK